MPYLLIRQTVEDYAKFKSLYDEGVARREEATSKGGDLFHNVDNPNEIVSLFEFEDLGKARQFAEYLRGVMQRGDLHVDETDFYFLEKIERTPV